MDQLREEKDLSWYFKKDGTIKKDYRVLHTMDEVRACTSSNVTNVSFASYEYLFPAYPSETVTPASDSLYF